ncbi:MAG: hypothetical protein N3A66_03935 [Planctomycetota bacterium]|nr:hypothetical protein [Planctomycetota bacterium]
MKDSSSGAELPPLLRCEDGRSVGSAADWPERRKEILRLIQEFEYGYLPSPPAYTAGELLHARTRESTSRKIRHNQYRLTTGPEREVSFILHLFLPGGDGPYPAIICGDDCWRNLSDDIREAVIERGYAIALFNRLEIAPDNGRDDRASFFYRLYPDGDFGALAAWAWGYQRCVDFLITLPEIDPRRLAVTGHSRGGKTALLAGATDERIALTAPNNSGCGGAGCFRILGEGSETLEAILRHFPFWFCRRLRDFIGQVERLPLDQHFVKALVAPRPLLTTEALGDLWANPLGTWHTHWAASEIYRLLGTDKRIGIWYREGGHRHGLEDWLALLDFADWQFFGKPPQRRFDINPFA